MNMLGSSPRPVVPAVCVATVDLLVALGGDAARDEALALLAPAPVAKQPDSILAAAAFLQELGLLHERSGRWSLAERDWHSESLVRTLRQAVLEPERNTALFESNEGTREFVRAAAWYLAQEVDDPPSTFEALDGSISVDRLMNQQLQPHEGEREVLQNKDRWQPFVRWARYFGLLNVHPADSQLVQPDPTWAIADELLAPSFPGAATEMQISDFLGALAGRLPVLDGGLFRSEVTARLRPGTSLASDTRLSPSLSLALERLHRTRRIDLVSKSDASDVVEVHWTANPLGPERYSHVRINTEAFS